jgi:hypothetical protein
MKSKLKSIFTAHVCGPTPVVPPEAAMLRAHFDTAANPPIKGDELCVPPK